MSKKYVLTLKVSLLQWDLEGIKLLRDFNFNFYEYTVFFCGRYVTSLMNNFKICTKLKKIFLFSIIFQGPRVFLL